MTRKVTHFGQLMPRLDLLRWFCGQERGTDVEGGREDREEEEMYKNVEVSYT